MKKILCLILVLAFSFLTMIGCNNSSAENLNKNNSISDNSQFNSVANSLQSSLSSLNNDSSSVINSQPQTSISSTKSSESTSVSKSSSTSQSSSNGLAEEETVQFKTPSGEIETKLNSAISSIVLCENNTVSRDKLILPRVSHSEICYIYWKTSNKNVIDLKGNVFQSDKQQTAKLTATFKIGEYGKTVDYNVIVLPKQAESPQINISSTARKTFVSTVAEFKTALNSATGGSYVVLKKGNYENCQIETSISGTSDNPVYVVAENAGSAVFSGNTTLKFKGNNVVVSGLSFENGMPYNANGCIIFEGDNCRLTNSKIKSFDNGTTEQHWVSLYGKRCEVDHNDFDGKVSKGTLLVVWRNDDSAQYHHIHDNVFQNYKEGYESNGFETIRLGDSKKSQSDSFCFVENNYFYACNGEIETISVKSGRNVIRGNVFKENKGSICLRHGKNNLVENNVFLCGNVSLTVGIRMYDGGHVVRNNYVEGQNATSDTRAGIVIHSGVSPVGEESVLNAQWTSYNCFVENNTAIDCVQSYLFEGKYAYGAVDTVVKNNVSICENNAGIRVDAEVGSTLFSGNVAYAKALLTSNSKINAFVGFTLKPYFAPTKNLEGLCLVDGIGANSLKLDAISSAGNY